MVYFEYNTISYSDLAFIFRTEIALLIHIDTVSFSVFIYLRLYIGRPILPLEKLNPQRKFEKVSVLFTLEKHRSRNVSRTHKQDYLCVFLTCVFYLLQI